VEKLQKIKRTRTTNNVPFHERFSYRTDKTNKVGLYKRITWMFFATVIIQALHADNRCTFLVPRVRISVLVRRPEKMFGQRPSPCSASRRFALRRDSRRGDAVFVNGFQPRTFTCAGRVHRKIIIKLRMLNAYYKKKKNEWLVINRLIPVFFYISRQPVYISDSISFKKVLKKIGKTVVVFKIHCWPLENKIIWYFVTHTSI